MRIKHHFRAFPTAIHLLQTHPLPWRREGGGGEGEVKERKICSHLADLINTPYQNPWTKVAAINVLAQITQSQIIHGGGGGGGGGRREGGGGDGGEEGGGIGCEGAGFLPVDILKTQSYKSICFRHMRMG